MAVHAEGGEVVEEGLDFGGVRLAIDVPPGIGPAGRRE